MHKNATAAIIATLLALDGVSVAFESSAAPRQISNTTTTTKTYAVGSSESSAIYAWIRDKSPEYGPIGTALEISVTSTEVSSGMMVPFAPGGGPPTPLPSSGNPGQTITIISTLPNGGFESWTYAWTGRNSSSGSWDLIAYEYKKGNLNIQ